jgi:dihydrofolate synthase/folylpolyglutamate synthase
VSEPRWEALFARRSLGIRLGLEAVNAAWRALGEPCANVPAAHVVGTNGKGSTSAMIDHALRGRGVRVGMYTSPHIHRVGERVRIGGVPDDDDALLDAVERVLAIEDASLPRPLSFFEILTLAAWLRFADAEAEVIVAEAGMGGRYDATRICAAKVVAIASIDLDHMEFLGDTLAKIAAEKVAVAKPGVRVFSVPQHAEVQDVLREHTHAVGAPLVFVEPLDRAPLGLVGAHQRDNAALALAATRVFVPELEARDLDGVVWPGRFERLRHRGGTVIVDVAHNPAGIAALLGALSAHEPRAHVLVGTVADKDADSVRRLVQGSGLRWAWADLTAFGATGTRVDAPLVFDDAAPTLAWIDARTAAGDTVCACGSHVLVAAIRAHVLGLGAAQPGERTKGGELTQ